MTDVSGDTLFSSDCFCRHRLLWRELKIILLQFSDFILFLLFQLSKYVLYLNCWLHYKNYHYLIHSLYFGEVFKFLGKNEFYICWCRYFDLPEHLKNLKTFSDLYLEWATDIKEELSKSSFKIMSSSNLCWLSPWTKTLLPTFSIQNNVVSMVIM